MDDPKLLTLGEAAQLLRVSPRTLEAWVRCGTPQVPSLRVGRRVLFDHRELERWLKTQTVRSDEKGSA